ncbi:unnamed protein product [Rhizoctonia solani]|uniref:BTB domain-containing protein n=1 Tax=Rhizoctonia solani TaxID=456999 RepID=A0A8H3BKU9_9AGAM|nr:unnamed protein product [Rhizoctonia solani]
MSSPAPRKHSKYYFEDGSITNDKTLFRLHKSVLRLHSTFFDDMFKSAIPPVRNEKGQEVPIDGSSDDHPIQLGGHSLATLHDSEMETMCEVLYDMPLTPASELQIDQAVALLRVAAKFQFDKIQARVIHRLDQAVISPAKRYAFAIDCLVDEWISRSYLDICIAVDTPSSELCAEFSQRGEISKLSSVLLLREDYRGKLLIYVHGTQLHPYTSSQSSPTSVCTNCLPHIKQLLLRILTTGGVADLDGSDPSQMPSLEQRLLKGIQPKSNGQTPISICANCRPKEEAIISQVLGIDSLKNEVRKVMHLP